MAEYQKAEKEVGRESRRKASRTGIIASEPESQAEATEGQPTRRIQQAVSKHPRASTFQCEPRLKKAKKGSEALDSAQIPEVIPPGAEE